jgi:hypothetical protein
MRAAGLSVPRGMDIARCHKAVFSTETVGASAFKQGECLALCMRGILDMLAQKGVLYTSDLEKIEAEELKAFDFTGKGFNAQDIESAASGPGVYGFKNKEGLFIYIGKSTNVRKRISGYFRSTDESPDKIERLRNDAHGFICSPCGSDLESLILEYRLIRKHSPALNAHMSIQERSGAFVPVDDCLVLLPHADGEKGMSVWFRKNQKILLRPFYIDFREEAEILSDLQRFFFGDVLPAHPTDFPELEIATRWVKRHADDLPIVPVGNLASAQEALDAMKSLWQDVEETRSSVKESEINQINNI